MKKTIILNDQGGAVMHISEDVTSTLRANTKHHEPIVLVWNGKADGAPGGAYPSQLPETTIIDLQI